MKKVKIYTTGFATLEIIIAFTLLIMAISGSMLVNAGNQSFLIDTETEREALAKAQYAITHYKTLFQNIENSTTTIDEIYTTTLSRSPVDFFKTIITARVEWTTGMRQQHISLSHIITDTEKASGNDTCDAVITDDWTDLEIQNTTTDFATLAGNSSKIFTLTDLDVYKEKLYVSANTTSTSTNAGTETLFVFNISNPTSPTLVSKIDNDTNKPGIAGISIASTSAGSFLYAASMSSFTRGQLQIINIGVTPPSIVTTYKIPTDIVPVAGESASIAYKNGYVYLGLSKTTGGDEFNIIDVHNPVAPVWVGGYGAGRIVNAVLVSDNITYLAKPAENADTIPEEITIMNVADANMPYRIGGYNAPDNQGHGKSLVKAGEYLLLGRTVTSSNDELILLDARNPLSGILPFVTSIEIHASVNDMFVRTPLIFTLAQNKLQTWNMSSTTNITEYASPINLPNGSTGRAIDCERNTLFVGSNDSNGRGYISIITGS